jgi:hypothetical protein
MSYVVEQSPYLGLFPDYSTDSSAYLGLFQLESIVPGSSYYGDMDIDPPSRRRNSNPLRHIESRRQIFDRDKLQELILLEKDLSIEEEDEISLLALMLL